jgi:hypothetical protein
MVSKSVQVIRLTVPQTQEFLERLANPFFPVLMSVHEIFSRCGFAYRRPVMEIGMLKQERRMDNAHAHFNISFFV